MLAERGARVVAGYYERAGAAGEAVAACVGLPGTAVAQQVDVRSRESVDALVQATLERWGQIDVLVNCAGLAAYAPIEELSTEQWRATLAANLDGAYHTCKAVLKPMMRRRYGRIVNVAALHGVELRPMDDLAPLKGLWSTSLHASGIRLRNAVGWNG